MTKLLLRVPEAAEVVGLSRSTIYELVASRQIPAVKIGRRNLSTTLRHRLREFTEQRPCTGPRG